MSKKLSKIQNKILKTKRNKLNQTLTQNFCKNITKKIKIIKFNKLQKFYYSKKNKN